MRDKKSIHLKSNFKWMLHCYIQPNNSQDLGQISAKFLCMVAKSLASMGMNK